MTQPLTDGTISAPHLDIMESGPDSYRGPTLAMIYPSHNPDESGRN